MFFCSLVETFLEIYFNCFSVFFFSFVVVHDSVIRKYLTGENFNICFCF